MTPEADALKLLASSGPLGLLCLLLLYGLRVLWRQNQELHTKVEEAQKARLADRDVVTKALVESTNQLAQSAEYLNSRTRR